MDDIDFTTESVMIRDIINKSVRATVNLWAGDTKTFWRSTEHRERLDGDPKRDPKGGFFPTVTFCCLEALAEFRTTLPEWHLDLELDQKLSEILDSYKTLIAKIDLDSIKDKSSMSEEGELNPFTISRYLYALEAIRKLDDKLSGDICKKIKEVAEKLTEKSGEKNWIEINVIEHSSNSHPFVMYHISRAYDSCMKSIEDKELQSLLNEELEKMISRSRDIAKELLALNAINALSASDAVALAFCAATLSLSKNSMDHRFIVPALHICFERQDSSGCWPLGRIVSRNKDENKGRLEISTYEIAGTLSTLVNCCLGLDEGHTSMLSIEDIHKLLGLLIKVGRYAQVTTIPFPREAPELEGWCTDHPFRYEMIESWTTASVLLFAIKLRSLIDNITSIVALKEFKSVANPWDENWPEWLIWKKHIDIYEPDTEFRIMQYIDKEIIDVIKNSPRQLPSAKHRSVSALLFGPPGTQKTSIAKAVADGLSWPIVLLSPGDFIEKGLEAIEAKSSEVFTRLHKLSQVVVLFDECDELFRMREPKKGSEQARGIAAFVTATMLPKIQDLHDKGRVVFFVCTNQFETIDPAIKRGGRVDHVIAVGPPDENARCKILENVKENIKNESITSLPSDVIKQLAKETDLFTIPELKHVFELVCDKLGGRDPKKDMIPVIKSVVESMRDSLTIGSGSPESKRLYASFNKQKYANSYPHIERRKVERGKEK